MIFPVFASLRARVLVVTLIAILPSLGLAFYASWEQYQRKISDAQIGETRQARELAQDQEQLIDSTRRLLAIVARLPEIREKDSAACDALLANILQSDPSYFNLRVVDPSWNIVCAAGSATPPLNSSNEPYLQRAMQMRRLAVGEYQIGFTPDKPALGFAYPVSDDTFRPYGILVATLDLTQLRRDTIPAQLSEGATFDIVDHNGTILLHYPKPDLWIGKSLPSAPLIRAIQNNNFTPQELVSADGVQRLYTSMFLDPSLSEPNLYVVLGIPTRSIYTSANFQAITDLLLFGLLTLIVIASIEIGTHLIVINPIQDLLHVTQRLVQGDLDARLGRAYNQGEMGELERRIDQIASTIVNQNVEQARVQQSLRRSAQKMHGTIEHSSDGIILADERGVITEWNRAQVEITGLEGTKTIGHNLWDVQFHLRPNKRPTVQVYQELKLNVLQNLRMEALESGPPRDVQIQTPNGMRRHLQMHNFRIKTANGYILGSITRDVTEGKLQEEQLAYLAVHDPLTGQANRRLLEETLKRAVARARRGAPSALMMMDADHFKEINDALGHAAGDQALITLSQLILKNLRTEDLLARIGGDEFAVLLEGSPLKQAQMVAERVLYGLREYDFVLENQVFKLGLSIGLIMIDGSVLPPVVLYRADTAMYQAKEQGGNRVVIYENPPSA